MTYKTILNRNNKVQKGLCVYMLHSNHKRRTYVGYTTNIKRRLRQHCGIISGGAKATRIASNNRNKFNKNKNEDKNENKNYDWEPIYIITGFTNRRQAKQLEWRIHHPQPRVRLRRPRSRQCYNPCLRVRERVMELRQIMRMERWTRSAIEHSQALDLTLWWSEDWMGAINMTTPKEQEKERKTNEDEYDSGLYVAGWPLHVKHRTFRYDDYWLLTPKQQKDYVKKNHCVHVDEDLKEYYDFFI
eukprot:gb/GECH01005457.1/.p1 GENE.gb/GECH01005457.1/~~gb/GECH01005457.1/.p1  ORF type:complete len:244 (+),score=42.51 gb/GECH01005457.1/:1-732(+)